jgi:hypothetical protein
LFKIQPKANGNGAKCRQHADKPQADRYTFCKLLDGQALFADLFHMYAATYKKMRYGLQPSSMESRQENASQAKQNNAERETETLKMCAAPGNRRGHLRLTKTHGQWNE